MITLENYVERYSPIVMLRISRELIESIIEENEVKRNKLIKNANKQLHYMHESVIGDIKGQGTIFQNII